MKTERKVKADGHIYILFSSVNESDIFSKCSLVPGVHSCLQLCTASSSLFLRFNNRFYLAGTSVLAGQSHLTVPQINTHTLSPFLSFFLSFSVSSSCCFSHQASGSSQVFDQCSVAGRLAVLSSVRQRQRASRRGMKGNGVVQPLLFTMGNLLSWVVEQITTFCLPFFNKH